MKIKKIIAYTFLIATITTIYLTDLNVNNTTTVFKENKSYSYIYDAFSDSSFNNYDLLIKNGYNANEITLINKKLDQNSINILLEYDYITNITNYLKLEYFKKDNLERYIKYYFLNLQSKPEDIITNVNIGLDNTYYTNTVLVSDPDNVLSLVNKYNYLNANYIPHDLEKLTLQYSTDNQYLRKEAKEAFEKMVDDARKENINIYAGSTYRSYERQDYLYNYYVGTNGIDNANTFSAKPGFSEHQLGLAIDILNSTWHYIEEDNIEYSWLLSNSYKYGFILRYPKEKEHITGYHFEPWHFRYLNLDIAKILFNNKSTYDEYRAQNLSYK